MKKQYKGLILICVVIATLVLSVFTIFASEYKDIKPNAWYEKSVEYCTEKGYFSGTAKGYFSPNSPMTREQLLQVLFNFSHGDKASWQGSTGFDDVSQGRWYSPCIKWAHDLGITNGVSKTCFGLGTKIDRQQYVTILKNYSDMIFLDTSAKANLNSFEDKSSVSSWARDSVQWAIAENIIVGVGGNRIDPKGYAYRCQGAQIIANYDDYYNRNHTHTWGELSELSKPTCENEGVDISYCSECDRTRAVYIPALGHNLVNCVCTRCGKTIHTFDKGTVIKDSTYYVTGKKQYKCIKCGYVKDEVIPKKDYLALTTKGYKITNENGAYFVNVNGQKVLIANKSYNLSPYYNPGDLTYETQLAFSSLVANARKLGLNIYNISGFRSYEYQKQLYQRYVNSYGKAYAERISARAGHSEHQTGLALDVSALTQSFINTKEGKWVAEHAHEYGFIVRYPKGGEQYTGYSYEPWHIRYLGVDLATKVYNSGLTLEQYLGIDSYYH